MQTRQKSHAIRRNDKKLMKLHQLNETINMLKHSMKFRFVNAIDFLDCWQ